MSGSVKPEPRLDSWHLSLSRSALSSRCTGPWWISAASICRRCTKPSARRSTAKAVCSKSTAISTSSTCARSSDFADPPRLYLEPLDLFRELTDHYLFATLNELFYSALLAENERRLQHLDGALRRVERTREDMSLRGNALRQEEITEEIEIILLSTGMGADL